jgi:hypothetical protein
MKTCRSCSLEKTDAEFHIRKASIDGLAAKCRSCQKLYDKARADNPDRVKARIYYAKTSSGIEAANRARQKWSKNNKGKVYETTKLYRKNNPNKSKAHGMVGYAIKVGNLHKEPCCQCGATEPVHAHHDDYAKPLNVRWLCAAHHREWHDKNGEGANAF